MRIDALEVRNFRGIRHVDLHDLKNTVIIAGANGSGKSCIFDAIRLLKSAYGGYQQNEWHQWMAEFQINFQNNPDAFLSFFQDRTKQLSIRCHFRLHPEERIYLHQTGKELVRQSVWRVIAPEMYGWSSYYAAPLAAQYRLREPEVQAKTEELWQEMLAELSAETVVGHLWAESGKSPQFTSSKTLELLFGAFVPGKLGLIDYHGPQRMYTREMVSSVNLDLNAQEQQYKQHALYNYNNKYSNVKTEMASSFIKEILAEKAGVKFEEQNRISKTLDELFQTFFPSKKFLGPQATPDGGLNFPVLTATGSTHDLNELSAGEKEVLYGYLRIRNSAPRFSVIMIDEPELHLNPSLIRGLPKFYHDHLGTALDNQIWLITHSDALLREAIGKNEYSVYHMSAASQSAAEEQIQKLSGVDGLEKAVLSLVGDLAAFQPGKRLIIFEGGGDSDFDEFMTKELFPEIANATNIISGGHKLKVRELHSVFEAAFQKAYMPFKIFSITDRDSDNLQATAPRYSWDVYHIENYLLEAKYILRVLNDINVRTFLSEEAVYEALRRAATNTINNLIRHEMTGAVNSALVGAINLRIDPRAPDIARQLSNAIERSADRIKTTLEGPISLSQLQREEEAMRTRFSADLATDEWRKTFRGREILKEFVGTYCQAGYETVRNLLIARMRDDGFRPAGMKSVIDKIMQS